MPDRALLIVGFILILMGLVWLGLMHQSLARMQVHLDEFIMQKHP